MLLLLLLRILRTTFISPQHSLLTYCRSHSHWSINTENEFININERVKSQARNTDTT